MSFYYARKKIPLQYTFFLYGIGCQSSGREKAQKLGASKTEEQGLEGIHAPSQSARIWKKAGGLGAKETEEQGLEGIRAPSQSARIWKKARGLGASETEEQGLERIHAPSQSARKGKRTRGLGAKETEVQRLERIHAPSPPCVANKRSQRNRSFPAIPFRILRIIPENAILVRNFVKIKGNDAK